MGLLPRVLRLAFGVTVLLALISLPTLRSHRIPGSALAPSVAWAGGSPDETLNPHKTPSTNKPTVQVDVTAARSMPKFTALERWEIFYRVFRTFAHRI